MHPTEILSHEHRVIEQVLDCIEALARAARDAGRLDVERAGEALEFVRTFADRLHHGKEEERLFPAMHARGVPANVGPIAVMLEDHRAGRALVQRMGEALGAQDGAARFATAARQYVDLLRDHIAKEDGVLFPMAESMLDGPGREALQRSFDQFQAEEAAEWERMVARADALARHFGVALAADRKPPEMSGHCGL